MTVDEPYKAELSRPSENLTEWPSQTTCQGLRGVSFSVSEAAAAVAGLAGTAARPSGPMGCSSFEAAEGLLRMLVFVSPEILLKSSAHENALARDNTTSHQRQHIPRQE